jgi:hypothetical protein
MDRVGSFTISLDFELFWGVRGNRELESYRETLLGVYSAIPKMLELFEKYEIHVTWATVGFLFHNDIKGIKSNYPSVLPRYKNPKVDPYLYLDELSSDNSDNFNQMHCAFSLVETIQKVENQEIASHTYSHFFTYEPVESSESFYSDMDKAEEVALSRGIKLNSLVFPRNQQDRESIKTLSKTSIKSYRGNPSHWAYSDGDKPTKSIFLRLFRLCDTYINLSGYHTSIPNSSEEVMELKASMMLRPYLKKLALLENLKIYRIKKAMKHAAQKGQNFHLWWHPHNFGTNQEKNLKNLEELLRYFQELQLEYQMLSCTMDEVNRHVKKQ